MEEKRFNRNHHCVYRNTYHLIWCPKYRRKVLFSSVENRLKELILEKSTFLKVNIIEMEVMPDHIHILVDAPTSISPSKMVGIFKGYSSRVLRQEFKHLKRMPSLWTRSYFCESIGHISEQIVQKYIQNQKHR